MRSRREARLELAGRAVIVFGVVGAVLLEGGVPATWATLVAVTCFSACMSPSRRGRPSSTCSARSRAVARGTAFGMLAASALLFLLGGPHLHAGQVAFCAVLVWALVGMWETAFGRWWAARRRVLIVGTTPIAAELLRTLADERTSRFAAVGIVDDRSAEGVAWAVPVLGTVEELPAIIARERPEIVVVALERNRPTTFGYLLDSAEAGFRVVEAAQFFEHAFGRVPIGDVTRAWFMSVLHLYQRPYSIAVKRVFDVVVAVTIMLVMLPLLPFLLLAVRSSRGS